MEDYSVKVLVFWQDLPNSLPIFGIKTRRTRHLVLKGGLQRSCLCNSVCGQTLQATGFYPDLPLCICMVAILYAYVSVLLFYNHSFYLPLSVTHKNRFDLIGTKRFLTLAFLNKNPLSSEMLNSFKASHVSYLSRHRMSHLFVSYRCHGIHSSTNAALLTQLFAY